MYTIITLIMSLAHKSVTSISARIPVILGDTLNTLGGKRK